MSGLQQSFLASENLGTLRYKFAIFSAVNKAYKTLENEEGIKRCREIIDEAKARVDEMVS